MYRFRLNTPTIAVRFEADGSQRALLLPDGAEVATDNPDVARDDLDGRKFVPVEWNGMTVNVFLFDLQERGEICDGG